MKTFVKAIRGLVHHTVMVLLLAIGCIIELIFAGTRMLRFKYLEAVRSVVWNCKHCNSKMRWNRMLIDISYNDMEEASKLYSLAYYRKLKKGS